MFYVYIVRDGIFVGDVIARGLTFDQAKAMTERLRPVYSRVAFQMMRGGE